MKVMMIGGTIFIGRELSKQLVEAGHEIAFLHRGDHEPPAITISSAAISPRVVCTAAMRRPSRTKPVTSVSQ